MRRTSTIILVLTLTLTLAVSGCAAPGPNGQTTAVPTAPTTAPAVSATTANPRTGDLMGQVQGVSWDNISNLPDPSVLQGVNTFSARLLQSALASKGNIMISPASVFLALAMTLNGADGDTRAAMLNVLAGQGLTADDVNEASRSWIAHLTVANSKTTVSIANSIWFNQGFRPDQTFLQTNADYFRAGASRLDFSTDGAKQVINAWVATETHGLIKQIIDKINPSTVMFLINTVYFKSDWLTPFLREETRKQPFAAPSGSITADFMHRVDKIGYFSSTDVQGVVLPYADSQFAYFALLTEPAVDPRTWLARQDPVRLFSDIQAWTTQKSNFTVDLTLPKYEVDYEDSLVDDLTQLGMGVAFDAGTADFSRLNEQHAKGLYISEVKHKTFIRVDEKGTEAAAATSVAIDESLPASDRQLVFDRPFIYGIMDRTTGTPLFVGILENPAE